MPYYDEDPNAMLDMYGCGGTCSRKFGKKKKAPSAKILTIDKESGIKGGLADEFQKALVDPRRILDNVISKNNMVNPVLFGINIAIKKRRRRRGVGAPTKKPNKKRARKAKKKSSSTSMQAGGGSSGEDDDDDDDDDEEDEEEFYDDE
jgi:hypothetical protein